MQRGRGRGGLVMRAWWEGGVWLGWGRVGVLARGEQGGGGGGGGGVVA